LHQDVKFTGRKRVRCAIIVCMDRQHRNAIAALAGAGVLWGLTVPLSKLSLAWLSPAWLTVARFAIAAPALGLMARRDLRAALRPRVIASGALGFGVMIVLQNAGIERTSVSDAAVIVGAVPVLVAVLAAAIGDGRLGPRRWAGNLLALTGVVLVAGIGAGGTMLGDGLVLASCALSAAFVVGQPRVLAGRDAAAVTAVQFGAGALTALPIALLAGGAPSAPQGPGPVLAFAALALAGTVLPFWLFAAGQARVRAEIASAYLNLEPVVGAAVGWLGFGEAAAPVQIAGLVIVLAGIALSTLPPSERPDVTYRSSRQCLACE
jgi:O-acetylserine/cysteine efflux transporter